MGELNLPLTGRNRTNERSPRKRACRIASSDSNRKVLASFRSVPSPDDGEYGIVTLPNGRSELWASGESPKRLADLGPSLGSHFFTPSDDRLVLFYSDRRTDVVDIDWLVQADKLQSPEVPDLLRLACLPLVRVSASESICKDGRVP